MKQKRTFLPPIPAGYQIYARHVEVAGVHHRKKAALLFAEHEEVGLRLRVEPDNPAEPNALMVLGVVPRLDGGEGTDGIHIGYVPREVTARIRAGHLFGVIEPRLTKIYVSDTDFIEIVFQILGPKDRKAEWDAAEPEEAEEEFPSGKVQLTRGTDRTRPARRNQPAGCLSVAALLVMLLLLW